MYTLIATNEQGASVSYNGRSINEVVSLFDTIWTRKGFKIVIYNEIGEEIKIIKKTHR